MLSTRSAILATVFISFGIVPLWGQAKSQSAPSKPAAQTQKAPTKQAAPAPREQEDPAPTASPNSPFPAVVARVNGKAIPGRDLDQRIQSELTPMGNPKWDNLRTEYQEELIVRALGSLVATELLHQKAVASGVRAADVEIKAEFEKLSKNFESDAAMNIALANRGLDRAGLNRELERNLVVTKYVQQNVTQKITVSPDEVSQYYSKNTKEFERPDVVRTSHILIMLPENATPEQDNAARARADALLARIKKGEDFAKLAKENSMDGSASQGGDIGFTVKGQLAPEYEQAAFSLSTGALSSPVRTQFGYHLIKVTDKKKAGLATLEEVREQLTNFLKSQKTEADLDKLVKELRTQAKIEILIPVAAAQPAADAPARQ